MTGPQSCLQTSPGFVWTLPIDILGNGECQMSVLLQFVWQNMIGLAGGLSHGLGGNKCSGENGPPRH